MKNIVDTKLKKRIMNDTPFDIPEKCLHTIHNNMLQTSFIVYFTTFERRDIRYKVFVLILLFFHLSL